MPMTRRSRKLSGLVTNEVREHLEALLTAAAADDVAGYRLAMRELGGAADTGVRDPKAKGGSR